MSTQEHNIYRRTEFSSDPEFFDWCRRKLPNARSFWITDVDAVLRDRRGNMALLEIKRRRASVPTHQDITYQVLDTALKAISGQVTTVSASGDPVTWFNCPVSYRGRYTLTFERTGFEDGRAWLNGREVSEQEVVKVLSFEND